MAVLFTSKLRSDADGYDETAARMEELARETPGFFGIEGARGELGVTICYWRSEEDVAAWSQNVEHLQAQRLGATDWYEAYRVRVATVTREYGSG